MQTALGGLITDCIYLSCYRAIDSRLGVFQLRVYLQILRIGIGEPLQ